MKWRYQYEPAELEELASTLVGKLSYVFFNNVTMFEDAKQFKAIIEKNSSQNFTNAEHFDTSERCLK